MTCAMLGQLHAFCLGRPPITDSLKTASRYRPIAIVPEGFTVRYHCFTVNNPG